MLIKEEWENPNYPWTQPTLQPLKQAKAFNEQHVDFLYSNICSGCLYDHIKWMMAQNKMKFLGQTFHWMLIPETTYSMKFLLCSLEYKGYVQL